MGEENSTTTIHESGISSVKLSKSQKNTYGWEIKIYGDSVNEILAQVEKANQVMLKTYGFVPPPNGDKEKEDT
jgi:hypothetical protein